MEVRVVAVVLIVLGTIEVLLRLFENRLSIDVEHIRDIPRIVSRLQQRPEPRILFLGNSLTRASIVHGAFGQAWTAAGEPSPQTASIHPDDTSLLDWHYLYRRHLQDLAVRPNLIVVSFAASQLEDGQEVHVNRLGSSFAGLSLAHEAFRHDLTTLDQRVQFLLSATTRLMAYRERVQLRILALFPGYRNLAVALNQGARARIAKTRAGTTDTRFSRLRRFLDAANAHHDRVVFVALPLPAPYQIPEDLPEVIHAAGMEFIDMQGTDPKNPSDFPDAYHMSEAAARRFSEQLATRFLANPFVRETFAKP